jgi:enoyl-CoA hydratase/carnithine racemase
VARLVAVDELRSATTELARGLSEAPTGVMALGRDSFYRWSTPRRPTPLAHLQAMLSLGSSLDDATEGTTAFLEKRRPNWSGS